MQENPENLSLFPGSEKPIDPRSGLSRNSEGKLVDSEGNVYDSDGVNIIAEKPSEEFLEELEKVRKRNPNIPEEIRKSYARANINRKNRGKRSGGAKSN